MLIIRVHETRFLSTVYARTMMPFSPAVLLLVFIYFWSFSFYFLFTCGFSYYLMCKLIFAISLYDGHGDRKT